MKIAVALHLFNSSLLSEFQAALAHIHRPHDLFVTVPDDGTEIQAAFPLARVYAHQPNRGMDIGGFFAVLPDLLAGDYEVVLKIHSKTDSRWRRILLAATCGSPEQVEQCLTLLETKQIGAVGASSLLFKDGQNGYWKRNQVHMEELAARHRLKLRPTSFIGGTMFWMKLAPLRKIFEGVDVPSLLETLNTPDSFDWAWYQSFYRDLHHLKSQELATQHWHTFGQREGRAPNGLAARARGLQEHTDGMVEHAYERFFGLLLINQDLIVKGVALPAGTADLLPKEAADSVVTTRSQHSRISWIRW
jgi:lipopolysaccharide biosynthesis protein